MGSGPHSSVVEKTKGIVLGFFYSFFKVSQKVSVQNMNLWVEFPSSWTGGQEGLEAIVGGWETEGQKVGWKQDLNW